MGSDSFPASRECPSWTQGWSCSAQQGKPPPGFSQIAMCIPKAGQQQFGVGMTSVRARQSSGLNPCLPGMLDPRNQPRMKPRASCFPQFSLCCFLGSPLKAKVPLDFFWQHWKGRNPGIFTSSGPQQQTVKTQDWENISLLHK